MTSPYAIALSHFAPFGSRTYVRLLEHFGDYERIWKAERSALLELGVSEKTTDAFLSWRSRTSPEAVATEIDKLGLTVMDRHDPHFPEALKQIYDPPILLYVAGELPSTNQLISIVGSRNATPYGLSTARMFARELTKSGLVVVSGLARGIDVEAHAGAMEVGGRTIAVLAHGLLELKGSKRLFGDQILERGGAIITEQPPRFKALNYHFPIRNRIIAGLCRGVVIVEAQLPSGTLHTAQAALNAHREVFAIPGPINSPTSAGANKLLQDGAHVTLHPDDVLLNLGLPTTKPQLAPVLSPDLDTPLSPAATLLLAQLTAIPIHVDALARAANLSVALTLSTLTILEIHGKVRPLGNMYYSL